MPQWLFEWMKVPSHVQLEGNVRADTLAELHGGVGGGRLRGFWDANYPCPPPPPPPLGAFGQQLVAKGVALRRPWAPKAPDAT